MFRYIANWLRRVAQWIDPQPIMIELIRINPPFKPPKDLVGFPVYFWRVDERTFSLYPTPDRELAFMVRP